MTAAYFAQEIGVGFFIARAEFPAEQKWESTAVAARLAYLPKKSSRREYPALPGSVTAVGKPRRRVP
jgi:hypothetical protein